ncbi:MAG: RNA polymerase-binding protein DksA [Francisellaceae bacterium]|nr:RNA polymerase-binding protein DksA [Francisellaceae bacterium]MBT6539359.1 RNA polymerase-binding protein DksA [Francisellaceae bacterium]
MVDKIRKSASKPSKNKAVTKKKSTSVKIKAKPKSTEAKVKKAPATIIKAAVKKIKKKTVSKTVTRAAKPPPTKNKAASNEQSLINGKSQPYDINNIEEYMCEPQLDHFRLILNGWKNDLMQEVDHTLTEMKEVSNLSDLNDRASQEESFALELRTRDRERKLIRKIESAIQQIDDEDYGYCESCGVEIGIRRLEARPTASLCIECKTLAEIREKRS